MANLHVRNVDPDLVARLKRRAARHGRSMEAEHREILRQALAVEVEPSWDDLAAELRRMTKRRKQTPSRFFFEKGATNGEEARRRRQRSDEMDSRGRGPAGSTGAPRSRQAQRTRSSVGGMRKHPLEKGPQSQS